MSKLLSREQWEALRRLYSAGKRGIPYEERGYGAAGAWPVLRKLREHVPPLAREAYRPNTRNEPQYFIVITESGEQFYEENERLHDMFYPPGQS